MTAWPTLASDHPLSQLYEKLPDVLKESEHNTIWGVTLAKADALSVPVGIVLNKFLRASANDMDAAAKRLTETLKWRKSFGLDQGTVGKTEDGKQFEGLGETSKIKLLSGEEYYATWNIYAGGPSGTKEAFSDKEKFVKWRIGLMEDAVALLHLSDATDPSPDYGKGPDPYSIIQIHDYNNVSFFRMDPAVKAASTEIIAIFKDHYPEWLYVKYFVNVPRIMGWVFTFLKAFVSSETFSKFSMLSYGEQLCGELKADPASLPKKYGGSQA